MDFCLDSRGLEGWAVAFTALALVPALFLPARRPIGPAEETLPVGVKPQAA